jgi:hypothetical protein
MFYTDKYFIEGILLTLCICFIMADIIIVYLILRIRNNQYVEINNPDNTSINA